MERILLFDSGCQSCSSIADEVQALADGWLTVRSLRDAEMRAVLDEARPGWRFEPTLR